MAGKVKRHNLDSSKQKPVVEYTRGISNEDKSQGIVCSKYEQRLVDNSMPKVF